MSQRIETIKELSELLEALLTTVRRLPPGPERHAALKQVGLFQVRLDTLAVQIMSRREPAAPAEQQLLDDQVRPGERPN